METHVELILHHLGRALHPSLNTIKGPLWPFSQDNEFTLKKSDSNKKELLLKKKKKKKPSSS